MAITVDVVQTTPGNDPTITMTGAGSPRAIIGSVTASSNTDTATDMTYPISSTPTSLTNITGSPFTTTTVGSGSAFSIRLLNGVDSGANNLVITTSGATLKSSLGVTLNAAADIALQATNTIDTATPSNPETDTLSLSGASCYCIQNYRHGNGNIGNSSNLTNWTEDISTDYGTTTGGVWTYDIIGTSDVTFGANLTVTGTGFYAVAAAFVESGGATVGPFGSLAGEGGLAGPGGLANQSGGLAG